MAATAWPPTVGGRPLNEVLDVMARFAALLLLCSASGCAAPIAYDPPVEELKAAPRLEFAQPENPSEHPFADGIRSVDEQKYPTGTKWLIPGYGARVIGVNCSREKDGMLSTVSVWLKHGFDYRVSCAEGKAVAQEVPRP